jgi:hypothetical protein
MARPRIAADKSKAVKTAVKGTKDLGAKVSTGPNMPKAAKAASGRIIAANKQAMGKKK